MGFKALLGADCLRLDNEILEGVTQEHELDAIFGKESVDVDNEENTPPTDWKLIMEEKVQDLKEKYCQLKLNDRNSREGNRLRSQINYIYKNMDREPVLPSTSLSSKVEELKKHLTEKLSSLDPVLSQVEDPEPTDSSVKIPKAGSVKSKRKIKSIVKPTHILETAEITTVPVINQTCPSEVSPIVSLEIESPVVETTQVFETYENDSEITIIPAINNPSPPEVSSVVSIEIGNPVETYENISDNNNSVLQDMDLDLDIVSYLCNSCTQEISSNEMATAVSCLQCNISCHGKCLSDTGICKICERQANIKEIRRGVKRKTVAQANYFVERSIRQQAPAQLYDTVLVPIPIVDKAKLEASNLLAIVLEKTDCDAFKLGTRSGILEGLFHRNMFQVTKEKTLKIDEVNMDIKLGVREAARAESVGKGQGFLRCTCGGQCITKKCNCLKAGAKCNSRCHGGSLRTCKNRDN